MSTMMKNRSEATRPRLPLQGRALGGNPAGATAALASGARTSAGLGLLRVILGIIFVAHGGQKLFSFTLPGVTEAFGGMGIPLPGITGPAVALVEFFGGIALVLGLFTTSTALALAVVMLGALVMVHLPAGFFLPNGIEFVLILFSAVVALALTGPGTYSVDAYLERRRSR